MAKLRLHSLRDEGATVRQPVGWAGALRLTRMRKMPPPGSPHTTNLELDSVVANWISRPRRVAARRLNCPECNNTLRDLLDVDLASADSFPDDDSGYDFDTNDSNYQSREIELRWQL